MYEVQTHVLQYRTNRSSRDGDNSLIDRSANGGLWGSEKRVLEASTTQTADVTGIDGHVVQGAPICTLTAKLQSTDGPTIGIFCNYALGGTDTLVFSRRTSGILSTIRSAFLVVASSSR
jgi:hypothetical protein